MSPALEGEPHESRSVSRTPHHLRIGEPVYTGTKVDLPLFDGEDAYGWLIRVERYFKLNQVSDNDKVEVVLIAMADKALNWYQWWEEKTSDHSWVNFKVALIRRFQPALVQNPFGPMLSVKQTSLVMEYRDLFERVVAPLKLTDQELLLKGVFLKGLRAEISAELKLHQTSGLTKLMDMALLLEQKTTQEGRTPAPERTLSENKREESPKPNKTWESGERLTQAELEERSKKGLCFKCGNKWGKEHVCGMKNY
ncbi:unnamed protein product [Cuscuta europaea]|uniref:Ty3 transposon capsid-like protein domain-containing protein n=1 Tax=Cuscuta europaea TaxID=41803 RepID=A0A9P1DZQ1_CUSEU|nr:unnamed protein product [Cuscuta europaea]